ncbi:uracil-DNA glycosylase-like protein [Zychaea mexicana]|uniref:uracil-DNA glycosylase-like protein n=1 Tax=Zychaea mexicana TaxID=64656 RepID=UPI0022FE85D9|nr:uracil-DNA glycosylase-like protein [Zychaea mexicana]KAI9493501.1 uracil-DNA glycosylase-like protein [Zychaea mexicana]
MFKKAAPAATDKKNDTASTTTTTVDSLEVSTKEKRATKDLFTDLSDELKTLLELELDTLHYDWAKVLKAELTKPYFTTLKKFLKAEATAKKTIYPPGPKIYSWTHLTPPSEVKVVIIGQDPYHGPNQAHGLCFSVVKGVRTPPSLENIYKALRNDFPDFTAPKHGFLEKWAHQGVLLLNTSLTVRAKEAGSHANRGWEKFTDAVIRHINEKKEHVVFMLWGAHAQSKGAKINKSKHLVLKSVHPSPLSAHRGFLTCGHFKQANEYLQQNARDPINWNCLADN